jgi:hypothetical protein
MFVRKLKEILKKRDDGEDDIILEEVSDDEHVIWYARSFDDDVIMAICKHKDGYFGVISVSVGDCFGDWNECFYSIGSLSEVLEEMRKDQKDIIDAYNQFDNWMSSHEYKKCFKKYLNFHNKSGFYWVGGHSASDITIPDL